jgi:oligosaccharyltransferase complex subunit delta (ribophorin II)
MRFQRLVALASITGSVLALQLSNGVLKTAQGGQQFTTSSPAQEPAVFDSTTSKLDITFEVEPKKIPQQLFIKVTNKDGVETSYKPITQVKENSVTSTFTLSYGKLPKLFTKESQLDISLIAAGSNDDAPIFTKVGSLQLTDELIAKSPYQRPTRFGPKPEIHHIFSQPSTTVNPTIALVFCALSIACFFILLAAWGVEGAINFKNFPGFKLSHLLFIGLVLNYEVAFFQYYLGSSIFDTIYKVALLTLPTLWAGSKVLNYVGALRLAGER